MKKILCSILVAIMVLTALAGCGKAATTESHHTMGNTYVTGGTYATGIPTVPGGSVGSWMDSLSGTERAKLLLASRRLNETVLNTDGNIFENGEKVMYDLIDIAIANLGVQYADEATITTASEENTTVETIKDEHGTTVKLGDKTVRWYGFPEINNSYGAFLNMTQGIVTEAKYGAELIGFVKKNIRVVSKWVVFGNSKYYLEVNENSEVLYENDMHTEDLKTIKRYKNEDGKDVYEMYRRNGEYENRTFYIPGERYEFSDSYQYFVADNAKGYWEVYSMNEASEHYNASYFIMKDDICYDAFYDPKNGEITMLKVMSEDRKADIFNIIKYYDGENPINNFIDVDLKFSGFNGIDYVETPREDMYASDWSGEGDMAYITSKYDTVVVHMLNGKAIKYEDTYCNGKVSVSRLMVSHYSLDGYHGEITLRISSPTYEEQIALLREFLNEVGFTCRRDIDGIFDGIEVSYEELEGITEYYSWNGVNVSTEAGIAEAIVKEKARAAAIYAEYEAIKNAETVEYTNAEDMEIHINFAQIIENSVGPTVLDGTNVTVPSVALTVSDTTLYVEEDPYMVAFALKAKNESLIHLEFENEVTVKYAGEKEFTVSAENASFNLPEVAAGEYTVVCYISTADGIRVSSYTELAFSEAKNLPVTLSSSELSAVIGEGGVLTLTYTEKLDHYIDISTVEALDFAGFKALVGEEAFKYGTPEDNVIEKLIGENYTSLTGEEEEIESGTYRIFYSAKNGMASRSGYVYINYICETSETPAPEGRDET